MGFLKVLLDLFSRVARYFGDKQLIDAGKATQVAKEAEVLENEVRQVQDAVRVDDPVRTGRLRDRFDRSRPDGRAGGLLPLDDADQLRQQAGQSGDGQAGGGA
jgi:hypothetical protein